MLQDLGQPRVSLDTNILDVEIPAQLDVSCPTGLPHVDALFAGDGVTPSTACLFTGIPGSGKTTLGLQLADAVAGQGHVAMYNTGEESLYQVRKVVRRLGLKNGFIPAYEASVQGIIRNARALQKKHPRKQVFVFVDSLQCVEIEREKGKRGREASQQNREVQVVAALTQWAKETFGVVVIVGMVGKDGKFLGNNKIKHLTDCHLHLSVDSDRKSETYGQRVATMEKNRFGQAFLGYVYELSSQGVKFETA